MDMIQSDIERVIKNNWLFDWLDNSTILITGATGFIGSMLIKSFVKAKEKYSYNYRIIGQIRDADKAEQYLGSLSDKIELVYSYDVPANHIIHTVSPTTSKFFVEYPVETINASVLSTMSVLNSAKKNSASLVFLSSMEQYGIPYEPDQRMTEDKIGVIDHLNVRSSYSESKRLCECLCASYALEYGVETKIARLAQTFGSGIPKTDNRMPMQFAKAVVDGADITLHTEGKSITNYVYITDALTGILTILKQGKSGQAYNICNDKETRSVYDIALLVSEQVSGGAIKVNINKCENMGYAPDVKMYLDSSKLRALGWEPLVEMTEGYIRLVEYIKELS